MKKVEDFVNEKTREERKKLLKLDESCHLRGLKYSTQLIALVAYHYDTTLPENGNKIVVCHGCMNSSCSNPNHMYWGTKKDNKLDDYELGGHKTIYQNMVKKYGETKAKEIIRQNASKGGKKNKGVPKSESHKQKMKKKMTS
jgi:hypothetical protein